MLVQPAAPQGTLITGPVDPWLQDEQTAIHAGYGDNTFLGKVGIVAPCTALKARVVVLRIYIKVGDLGELTSGYISCVIDPQPRGVVRHKRVPALGVDIVIDRGGVVVENADHRWGIEIAHIPNARPRIIAKEKLVQFVAMQELSLIGGQPALVAVAIFTSWILNVSDADRV